MRDIQLLTGSRSLWAAGAEMVFLGWSDDEPIRVIVASHAWHLLLSAMGQDEAAAREAVARAAERSTFERANAPRGYDVRVQRIAQLRSVRERRPPSDAETRQQAGKLPQPAFPDGSI